MSAILETHIKPAMGHAWNVVAGHLAKYNDREIRTRKSNLERDLKEITVHWGHSLPRIQEEAEGNPRVFEIIAKLFMIQEYEMGRITIEMLNNMSPNLAGATRINMEDTAGPNSLNLASYLYVLVHIVNNPDRGVDLTNMITRIDMQEVIDISKKYTRDQALRYRQEALADEKVKLCVNPKHNTC